MDVAIIGGGYTGLQAAYNLAKRGASVALIEASRLATALPVAMAASLAQGSAPGRTEQEKELGYERAKALFDLAENAKRHLLEFAEIHGIDMDITPAR